MSKAKIVGLVSLATASLLVAIHFWPGAFPVAALDFRFTRAETQKQIGNFIESQGHHLDGYHGACFFGEQSSAKQFIELEYGVTDLEKLARKGLNIWYWSARWFKPETHEEFRASVDTQGNLIGFWHTIEEERARPFLEKDGAKALAEKFLQKYLTQHPWDKLRFISGSVDKKTHRTDYSFVWERDDLRLNDAPYRLTVTIQGNEIGGYSEFLKVPEAWTRNYAQKRDVNQLCETIAGYFLIGIMVGCFVLLIVYVKRGQVRWKNAIPWGWLALFGIVELATRVNNLPQSFFNYDTTQSWSSFLAQSAFEVIRGTLGGVVAVWLLMLVADAIYRQRLPQHPSFRYALGVFALRDPRTLRAIGVGIVFALFGLAYVSVFYVVGRRFGVWCPVDIDYSKTMSGLIPWIQPLQIGLSASFGEEMLFRIIGILLFWQLLRVRWLAVILAAATWGFLHSTYPQMPGYIRGIELTAEGILWGALMLRFGVVCTLTTHYLYDCWLGSWFVFQSPSWSNKAGALIVSLWPVALFLWGCWKKADMPAPEEQPAPMVIMPPPLPSVSTWDFSPVQLSGRQRWLITFFCAAALVAISAIHRPQDKFAAFGAVDVSRKQVAAKADALLNEHGQMPSKYKRTITLYSTSILSEYLLEHGSLDQLAGLFQAEWPDLDIKWGVRYFQILQREEFYLEFDKHGNLTHWNHTIPREAAGASLDRDTALAKAKEYLARDHHVDFEQENLVRETPVKQEKRRDYGFVFERNNWPWGEAKLRTYIKLQGDEPVHYSRYVEEPEAWTLKKAKSGWKKFAADELGKWVSIAEGIIFSVLFVMLLRKHVIPWRKSFKIGAFPTLLELLNRWNHLPWFFAKYSTTTPLKSFLIKQWGTATMSLAVYYLAEVLLICMTLGFLRWSFGWTLDKFAVWPSLRKDRGKFLLDCLFVGTGSIIAFSALHFLLEAAEGVYFPERVAYFHYPAINVILPWLNSVVAAFGGAFNTTLKFGIQASIAFLIYRKYPKTICTFIFIYPILEALKDSTLRDFFFDFLSAELRLGLSLLLLLWLWRFNPALIFLTYATSTLVNNAAVFIQKGGPNYQWQAFPLLLIPALLAIICFAWYRQSESEAQPVQHENGF